MRTLKIKVTFVEDVLGTANANPDIHKEWIASKAPEERKAIEELEAISTEEKMEKTMTVFARNDKGQPIVWDYQWKGFFKDAVKSLKKIPGSESSKIKAYKQEIDGLVFVSPRQIPFELSGDISICSRPLRASTPQGERVALTSSESVPKGSTMVLDIHLMLPAHEKMILECLDYGKLRGFGQWRNSGKGRFTYEVLERDDV